MQKHLSSDSSSPEALPPSMAVSVLLAGIYVLSGVTQPLIMTLAKEAGLADSSAQLYMLFYYMGPASVSFFVVGRGATWPSRITILKCGGIAMFDLIAQALNYTGSTLAGPTLFAIIYSSVTVWTAVFSRFLLLRQMSLHQWLGVCTVFGGLTIAGLNSASLGPNVFHGSCLVLLGSMMHALTYVLSEAIMTKGTEPISVPVNCAIQGVVCCIALLAWQLIYTRPHYAELILEPMQEAGTTLFHASCIMFAFSLANFLHSICFFHTLKHFPGGATSAGVMKGLQAVLVFVVTSWAYCGRLGGKEMCFSRFKLVSLIVVVGGVIVFGRATEQVRKGYTRIESVNGVEAV